MGLESRLRCIVLTFGLMLLARSLEGYQEADYSPEELQQVKVTERFYELLQRSPKRGTAFDRVYNHHLEFGTLDSLMETLYKQVATSAQDGNAWMLLGLFQSQRGDDISASTSFGRAASIQKENALPFFYRGQSLARIGNIDEAIASLEQALSLNAPRADRQSIYEQLGRMHLRAQRTDKALEVWQRLEKEFPDDLRVLEQIAGVVSEEGDFESAIPRLEKLAQLVKDDYRRTVFRVQSASLRLKANQRDAGLKELESVLRTLNPTSWLYRDVRAKIEDTFLASSNQAGLVEYYIEWLKTSPEDIEGMARLAKFLNAAGRAEEADGWMEKAIVLAPSRPDLRKAYIDHLLEQKRISKAIEQYQSLTSFEPSNPDYLRDWGRLVLRDNSLSKEARNEKANQIWKQLLALRQDDPSHVASVADLYRSAGFQEDARKLFEQAIVLAPNEAQYREYLGEFLHTTGQSKDAVPVWKSMADGPRRSTENLSRLADVFKRFGFHDLAAGAIEDACRLEPADFPLQLEAAQYLMRVDRMETALGYTTAADKLAETDGERDSVIQQRIEILQATDQLNSAIVQLATEIRQDEDASPERWHTLAKYCVADNQLPLARESIEKALQLNERSISFLTTASKIAEASGDLARAIEICRKLTTIDRRSMSEYLTTIAKLELQLNRPGEALKTAQELVRSAPGNTEHYEFLAQVSFRAGDIDQGLNALRKAVRINPNEPYLCLELASALAERGKSDEAIDVYWRAFDRAEKLEDQILLIVKLVPLYQGSQRMSALIDRLTLLQRDEENKRAMTICLAQAHTTALDFALARTELESLLTEDSRDTALLHQLASLCQDSKDLESAIKYQRRLVSIAPGAETELILVKMLQEQGQADEANSITLSLALREDDPIQQLKTIDSLIVQSSYSSVVQITRPLLLRESDNWELLYREAVAFALQSDALQSAARFRQLLDLKNPHESLGAIANERLTRSTTKKLNPNVATKDRTVLSEMQSPFDALRMVDHVQSAVQHDDNQMTMLPYTMRQQRLWMPDSFGLARMAAIAWLLKLETEEDFLQRIYEKGVEASQRQHTVSKESLLDFLYLAALQGREVELFETARGLAKQGGAQEKEFFLSMVQKRGSAERRQNLSPLDESDLQLMLECFESLPSYKRFSSSVVSYPVSNSLAPSILGVSMNGAPTSSPLIQQQLQLHLARQSSMMQQILLRQQLLQQAMIRRQSRGSSLSTRPPNTNIILSSGGAAISSLTIQSNWTNALTSQLFLVAVMEELQLAEKEQELFSLLDRLARSVTDLREFNVLLMACLNAKQYKKLSEYYPLWEELAKKDIKENGVQIAIPSRSNSIAQTSPFEESAAVFSQWIGNLAPQYEHDEILRVLDSVLNLAVLRSKALQSQRSILNRQRSSLTQFGPQQPTLSAVTYGSDSMLLPIDFPPPNDYLDRNATILLRQVHEVLQRNGEIDRLESFLRKRVAEAKEPNQAQEQIFLACGLWWKNEPDAATELMLAASKLLKQDTVFQVEVATLLHQRRRFAEALEIADSINTADPDLDQKKQWLIVSLAEQLGDSPRTIQAIQRLATMTLDRYMNANLAFYARRFGLTEIADLAEKRNRTTGRRSTPTRSSSVSAVQNAKAVLARPIPAFMAAQTLRSVKGQVTSVQFGDTSRRKALDTLKSAGELSKMVEGLEAEFSKSPKVFKKYEQLTEIYHYLNQPEKMDELYQKTMEACPESAKCHGYLAKALLLNGQTARASSLYVQLVRDQPDVLSDQVLLLVNCFAAQKRLPELVEYLRAFDLRKLNSPYEQIELVGRLLGEREFDAFAGEKFGQVYNSQPMYRGQLLNRFKLLARGPRIELQRSIGPTIQNALVPDSKQSMRSPWFGLDDIQPDDIQQGQFGCVLGILDSKGIEELSLTVRQAAENDSNWLGGQALSAVLSLRTKHEPPEIVVSKLRKLLSPETIDKMSFNAAWNLAKALEPFEESRRIELELLSRAVAASQNTFTTTYDDDSPAANYLRLLVKLGEGKQALTWLKRQVAMQQISQLKNMSYDFMRFELAYSFAQRMSDIGFPLDAMRVYQQLLYSPAVLDSNYANAVLRSLGMNESQTPKARCENGIKNARAKMQGMPIESVVTQLTEEVADATDKLPLDINATGTGITSHWTQNVEHLINYASSKDSSQAASIWESLLSRLAKMQSENPDDLSIAVAIAWARMKSNSTEAEHSLDELRRLAKLHRFEALPTTLPSSAQRKDAARWIALFVVARECLSQHERKATGEELATKALDGARLQSDKQWRMSLLREWGDKAHALGDTNRAEAMLTQLLEIVTERPVRPQDRDSSTTVRLGPLARQQVLEALAIAKLASERGMTELSRRAVREAMVGGIFDSNPTLAAISAPAQFVSGRTIVSTNSPQNAFQVESTFSVELVNTVSMWRNADHPANEVFLLLRDIVFSRNPRHDISLYSVVPNGSKAVEKGSIANEMVYWANEASKLDELEYYMDDWTTKMDRTPFRSQTTTIRKMIQQAKSN